MIPLLIMICFFHIRQYTACPIIQKSSPNPHTTVSTPRHCRCCSSSCHRYDFLPLIFPHTGPALPPDICLQTLPLLPCMQKTKDGKEMTKGEIRCQLEDPDFVNWKPCGKDSNDKYGCDDNFECVSTGTWLNSGSMDFCNDMQPPFPRSFW